MMRRGVRTSHEQRRRSTQTACEEHMKYLSAVEEQRRTSFERLVNLCQNDVTAPRTQEQRRASWCPPPSPSKQKPPARRSVGGRSDVAMGGDLRRGLVDPEKLGKRRVYCMVVMLLLTVIVLGLLCYWVKLRLLTSQTTR